VRLDLEEKFLPQMAQTCLLRSEWMCSKCDSRLLMWPNSFGQCEQRKGLLPMELPPLTVVDVEEDLDETTPGDAWGSGARMGDGGTAKYMTSFGSMPLALRRLTNCRRQAFAL